MFQKVLKTARGKWSVVLAACSVIAIISSASEGKLDARMIAGIVMLFAIAVALALSAAKTINSPASVIWSKWAGVPPSEAQIRRLERGIECGFTPKKVDLDAKYAVIVGASDQKPYKTTLTRCTCPDFQKRKLPCKHMYYLALQTGAIDENGIIRK